MPNVSESLIIGRITAKEEAQLRWERIKTRAQTMLWYDVRYKRRGSYRRRPSDLYFAPCREEIISTFRRDFGKEKA